MQRVLGVGEDRAVAAEGEQHGADAAVDERTRCGRGGAAVDRAAHQAKQFLELFIVGLDEVDAAGAHGCGERCARAVDGDADARACFASGADGVDHQFGVRTGRQRAGDDEPLSRAGVRSHCTEHGGGGRIVDRRARLVDLGGRAVRLSEREVRPHPRADRHAHRVDAVRGEQCGEPVVGAGHHDRARGDAGGGEHAGDVDALAGGDLCCGGGRTLHFAATEGPVELDRAVD